MINKIKALGVFGIDGEFRLCDKNDLWAEPVEIRSIKNKEIFKEVREIKKHQQLQIDKDCGRNRNES